MRYIQYVFNFASNMARTDGQGEEWKQKLHHSPYLKLVKQQTIFEAAKFRYKKPAWHLFKTSPWAMWLTFHLVPHIIKENQSINCILHKAWEELMRLTCIALGFLSSVTEQTQARISRSCVTHTLLLFIPRPCTTLQWLLIDCLQ